MRTLTGGIASAVIALGPAALGTQARHLIGAEVVFGVGQRSEHPLTLPTDGVQAAGSAGSAANRRRLRLGIAFH